MGAVRGNLRDFFLNVVIFASCSAKDRLSSRENGCDRIDICAGDILGRDDG
jgi:hypothetical protein